MGHTTTTLILATPGVAFLAAASTFYLKVNGVPVYAKGSNLVPHEVLPSRKV
jgi:hypothetical protein